MHVLGGGRKLKDPEVMHMDILWTCKILYRPQFLMPAISLGVLFLFSLPLLCILSIHFFLLLGFVINHILFLCLSFILYLCLSLCLPLSLLPFFFNLCMHLSSTPLSILSVCMNSISFSKCKCLGKGFTTFIYQSYL